MTEINELSKALSAAAKYFDSRGFSLWANEARDSIERISAGDISIIEKLYLKYAPTCEVEELFITEYELADEEKINELNQALSEVIKNTYWALEHARSANT